MITLHSYILRELLKTFLLTQAAIAALFTMGGGVYNLIRYENVSAADVVGFIPMLVPIVVTLTMPMAALFATTMVYGRLAADNEFNACRAAGINVHRLFGAALLLSVFVAAFTLAMGNFVIPGMTRQLDSFARSNLRDIAAQKLQSDGFVHRAGKNSDSLTLTARGVIPVDEGKLRSSGWETGNGLSYLQLDAPTFLHVDRNGEVQRFTVARVGLCQFDTRTTPIQVTLDVKDARDFQVGKQAVAVGRQQIRIELPLPSPSRLASADLPTLLRWSERPWEADKTRDETELFLALLRFSRYYEECAEQVNAGGHFTLVDGDQRTYDVRAQRAVLAKRSLQLEHATVLVGRADERLPVKYQAARADLIGKFSSKGNLLNELRLVRTPEAPVREYTPRGGRYDEPREKPTLSLDNIYAPADVSSAAEVSAIDVLAPDSRVVVPPALADERTKLRRAVAAMGRKVASTIHFRLGFTSSVLVTIVMGAALSVILRGSRALAAFGIGMIPFFCVFVLMVIGKQVTENAGTTAVGPFVTWGGLGLFAVADFILLQVGVRR